jgi:hypothetical protein
LAVKLLAEAPRCYWCEKCSACLEDNVKASKAVEDGACMLLDEADADVRREAAAATADHALLCMRLAC